jgi:hypothetical protein
LLRITHPLEPTLGKPDLVAGVLWKMVIMDLHAFAERPQRLGDDLSAERTIDEEYPGLRQPPGSRS